MNAKSAFFVKYMPSTVLYKKLSCQNIWGIIKLVKSRYYIKAKSIKALRKLQVHTLLDSQIEIFFIVK